MTKQVYKTTGELEKLSPKKLFTSIKKSCLATNHLDGDADSITKATIELIEQWLTDKDVVTSLDLRVNTRRSLQQFCPEAAYFYWNYRDII